MLLQNCLNIDCIRLYRDTWRYIEIHEIGTEITIPSFISIYILLKTPDLMHFSIINILLQHHFRTNFVKAIPFPHFSSAYDMRFKNSLTFASMSPLKIADPVTITLAPATRFISRLESVTPPSISSFTSRQF